jgi:hypothetical protein
MAVYATARFIMRSSNPGAAELSLRPGILIFRAGHVWSEFYSRMERRGFLITATIAHAATIQESPF